MKREYRVMIQLREPMYFFGGNCLEEALRTAEMLVRTLDVSREDITFENREVTEWEIV